MKTSKAGLDLIKRHEDARGWAAGRCFELRAYKCDAGVWTIAWGHTRGVYPGMCCTEAQAELWLLEDVALVDQGLTRLTQSRPVPIELTQSEWDALSSLCYNLRGGPAALPKRAPKLWAAICAGDKQAAANEFLDINKANGQVMAGLVERRKEEAFLYLS